MAALVDAACLPIAVDASIDPAEVDYAEGLAAELFGIDRAAAAPVVRDALARIVADGGEAVRASIAARLESAAEREVAYLTASGAIYRDGHLAHREAGSLAEIARVLALDRATVDRLSTDASDDRLVLGALYPPHWRLEPASLPGMINDELAAWAEARGLLRDPRAAAALRAMDLESFQRLTFPRCADTPALLWAAKYTLWLYFFDDVVESFTGAGEFAKARAFVAPCIEASAAGISTPDTHPLVQTFAELTSELYARSSDPDLPSKWQGSHRRYWLLGILSEVETSNAGNVGRDFSPAAHDDALRHHLGTRPWASGVEIYFDIGEVICDALLPPDLHAAAEIEDIRYVGALIGGVFNDLLSYDKEKPFDNLANTALALRREFELDDRGALTYAITLHNELVRECDDRIASFMARGGSAFALYADMLRQVLHGLAAWQLRSRRYVNRHAVVISSGEHRNPEIDADRVVMLQKLAMPPARAAARS